MGSAYTPYAYPDRTLRAGVMHPSNVGCRVGLPSRTAPQSLLQGVKLAWSSTLWRRLFWLTMGVVHAPALLAACRSWATVELSASHAGWCGALLSAGVAAALLVLFTLKFLDVPFLRLRLDKRSYTVLCIIVALLHLNVLQPAGERMLIPDYAAFLVTTCLAAEIAVRRRLTLGLREPRSPQGVRPPQELRVERRRPANVTPSSGAVWLDNSRPHCFASLLLTFGLRAPPA